MSNAVALRTHLRPGDEFIAAQNAHQVISEGGGYAALAGAAVNVIETERGVFSGEQVTQRIRPDDPHYARTRLVCVENTHNAGGGTVWTEAELTDVTDAARANGLALHLDGARLLNAAVALGTSGLRDRALALTASRSACPKGWAAPSGRSWPGPARS